jgi:hypothetical protein
MSQTTNTIDVVFTPNAGFTGTADFRFYATDGSGAGNTATVTINVAAAATSTPTATPIPTVMSAPGISGWGLAALIAGMLVVMVIALGLTSGSRPAARP